MSDIRIPDDSEFQGPIDHAALVAWLRAQYGAAIAISRLCYGDLAVDKQADRNIDGFRAAGADALGWYLYLIAGRDPVAQADTFCRVLQAHGGLRRNEFVVVDDEESTGGDESGRVNAALAEIDAQLQAAASQDMWYSGLNFAQAHNLPAANGHRWIAAYQSAEPTSVAHDLWQNTDAMSFPGIANPCDASVFHGTLSDFLALIGAGGTFMAGPLDDPGTQQQLLDQSLRTLTILTDGVQSVHDWNAGTTIPERTWPVNLNARFDAQDAMLKALLADAGAEQAAIDAIAANGAAASQVATLLTNLATLQTSVSNLANLTAGTLPPSQQAELDAIKAATDGLTVSAAATAKHLGVGTA